MSIINPVISSVISRAIKSVFASKSKIIPVTEGMTLTASWVTRGTGYATLANATSATIRVKAAISNTDEGILMESGAGADGLILYTFAGFLYFQCGEGATFGTAAKRAEVSYQLPIGQFTYIIEPSANTANAVLYVNGNNEDSQTFSNSTISGGNAGTVGRVSSEAAANRGGWTADGEGNSPSAILECEIFVGQVTPDV
jgi:hypothetical protein